jgi:hypothetical protein
MESFPDSLFPVLVVAAFVGFRILLALRRRKQQGQKQGEESVRAGSAPTKARGFVPWEDAFRDAALAGNAEKGGSASAGSGNDDEAFSAWDLSVDDEPPVKAAPPKLPKAPPGALGPLTAVQAGQARFPETPVPGVLAAAPSRFAPEGPAQQRRPARAGPEARFRGLSPLQQGVVWAEILGAPRGLGD